MVLPGGRAAGSSAVDPDCLINQALIDIWRAVSEARKAKPRFRKLKAEAGVSGSLPSTEPQELPPLWARYFSKTAW